MTWWKRDEGYGGGFFDSRYLTGLVCVTPTTGNTQWYLQMDGGPVEDAIFDTEDAAKEALRRYANDPDSRWLLVNDGHVAINLDMVKRYDVYQELLPGTRWSLSVGGCQIPGSDWYDTKDEANDALADFLQAYRPFH